MSRGDDKHPNYRSRFVAREICRAGEDSIFAPTPPLESLRMVLYYAVTDFPDELRKVRDPKYSHRCQLLAIDISRAYFNAVTPMNLRTLNYLPKLEVPLVLVRSARDTCTGRNAPPMDGKASIPGHCVDCDLLRMRHRHACSGTKSDSVSARYTATALPCRDHAHRSIGSRLP